MRTIIIPAEPGTEQQRRLCDWIRANNLDPAQILTDPPVVIEDDGTGHPTIHFTEFLTINGARYFTDKDEPGDENGGYATAERQAPLIAAHSPVY